MERYQTSILINAPIESVFHFHDDTRNLLRITPPGISVSFTTSGDKGLGQNIHLTVKQFKLFATSWHVRITQYEPPVLMVDEQVKGPFGYWKQTRKLRVVGQQTELTDIVEYEAPFGVLGLLASWLVIRRQISSMFAYRQQATKRILEAEY
ncbi:MAG: SRPBCC family protein [Ignavibacteria bacterium]|jgi:ligand-binding SRPBCC domain-containing protein